MKKIHERIMKRRADIICGARKAVDQAIASAGCLDPYTIAWRQLQTAAIPALREVLALEFPDAKFVVASSKSTYPDLKMSYCGRTIAFDVKSNQSEMEPWYDIARLGTVVAKRLDAYDEEYDLLLKYDRGKGILVDAYFELMRHTVGWHQWCGGVLFRPYDGKLRPKSWDDFMKGKVYWNTPDDFREGIRKSQICRWKRLLSKEIIPILTMDEKRQFRELFK